LWQTQVGRNFKQYGLLKKLLPVKFLQVCEYFLQRIALLQFAQPGVLGELTFTTKKSTYGCRAEKQVS
jgi:hypothetical protein